MDRNCFYRTKQIQIFRIIEHSQFAFAKRIFIFIEFYYSNLFGPEKTSRTRTLLYGYFTNKNTPTLETEKRKTLYFYLDVPNLYDPPTFHPSPKDIQFKANKWRLPTAADINHPRMLQRISSLKILRSPIIITVVLSSTS